MTSKIFKYLSKIKITRIKKRRILVYDQIGSNDIKTLLKILEVNVLDSRFNSIDLHSIVKALFYRAIDLKIAYYICFIKKSGAEILITHIDNDINFYKIKKYLPNLRVVAIQNGTRTISGDIFSEIQTGLNLSADYIFVHNKYIGNLYSKYIDCKVHEIGSMRSNLDPRIENSKKIYSILFVSQFFKANGSAQIYDKHNVITDYDFLEIDKRVFRLVESITHKMGIKLTIQLRGFQEEEKLFYNSISSFQEHSYASGLPYQNVDRANLVVSVDSTLGYESLGRGNKTLFLTIRGSELGLMGYDFGWPVEYDNDGPFWMNNYDEKLTELLIRNLYYLSLKGWAELYKVYAKNIMKFNSNTDVVSRIILNGN